jgi:hypothetical protein
MSDALPLVKPLVFVAAVYEGNPVEFRHGLLRAATSLRAATHVVPVLPDLRILEEQFAGDRFGWEWDLISRCDALVVIGGRLVPDVEGAESCERWIEAAREMDVPVFEGPGDLFDWVANR